ncbi:MAG: ribosome recycling factor [Candidatus Shikimatogenerans bostrichidophilus]|nr:MAG: ribosome recycling factor [Candidatus Shikimatogenerans bostrichidophilus]
MLNYNILKKIDIELNKYIFFFKKYLSNIHLGIINTYMLKNIKININNNIFNIYELSNINIIDKITLKIIPYEKKNLNIIKKSLLSSNIEGTIIIKNNNIIIKLSILTEEKRIDLIKKIKIELEKIIISLRLVRNKFNNKLNKFSEDEKKQIKKKIQIIFNNKIIELQKMLKLKKKEILKI